MTVQVTGPSRRTRTSLTAVSAWKKTVRLRLSDANRRSNRDDYGRWVDQATRRENWCFYSVISLGSGEAQLSLQSGKNVSCPRVWNRRKHRAVGLGPNSCNVRYEKPAQARFSASPFVNGNQFWVLAIRRRAWRGVTLSKLPSHPYHPLAGILRSS